MNQIDRSQIAFLAYCVSKRKVAAIVVMAA